MVRGTSDGIRRRATIGVTLAALVIAVMPTAAGAATAFPNCTALNRVYPAGVAHPDAKIPNRPGWVWQRVSGKRVAYRPSKIGAALYNANTRRDGDKDKVACETSA